MQAESLFESNSRRQTFAIISHPDAGKTTVTEQLLLLGGAIQLAGTVKARKSTRHATSDWMALEKQRGISVTTSVMQICYQNQWINLLDTPGHADFSEDTYRTLTAVDSVFMVIDAARGVEERTIKLMDVCRLRNIPIMTFINKLDRDGQDPLVLLDEIERILKIHCVPMTWPLGMGRHFAGVTHVLQKKFYFYPPYAQQAGIAGSVYPADAQALREIDHPDLNRWSDEMALIKEANTPFALQDYLAGVCTPVYFGTALNQFGLKLWLDDFIRYAPTPQPRATTTRVVHPEEPKFTGFVFKIQANMDAQHRDRIAFLRVVSGQYRKGQRLLHVRTGKKIQISRAVNFLAGERVHIDTAQPGDIIGIYNHGTIKIGDTLTEQEPLTFVGIPNFAPELFRFIRLRDPLKAKALLKGLLQLSEEGAVQIFRPLVSHQLIVGAVGALQFETVAYRLEHEYGVACQYDTTTIGLVRWVQAKIPAQLSQFKSKYQEYLAIDGGERLVYLATSRVHLQLLMERNPDIEFFDTCEHV